MDSIPKVIICLLLILDMFICSSTMFMHFDDCEKGFAYIDAFHIIVDIIVFIIIQCFM